MQDYAAKNAKICKGGQVEGHRSSGWRRPKRMEPEVLNKCSCSSQVCQKAIIFSGGLFFVLSLMFAAIFVKLNQIVIIHVIRR